MGGTFGTTVTAPNPIALSSQGIFVQVPNLSVTVRGRPVNATLLGATISYGHDIGIATASIEFTAANIGVGTTTSVNVPGPAVVVDPTRTLDGVNYFDPVVVSAGGDPAGSNYNAVRFTGLYVRTEATMWPGVFQMICKGNLYRATQYYESTVFVGFPTAQILGSGYPTGTPLVDFDDGKGVLVPGLINGQLGVDTTDQNIIRAILAKVNGLNFDPANIDGTGKVINLSYHDATWPPYRSAWDQIQTIDYPFLGFRTFEDLGGTIRRAQIYGYPQPGSMYSPFVEGIHIWEAEGTRSVEQLINASYVEGMSRLMDSSTGTVQLVFAYVPQSNPFQGNAQQGGTPVVEQFRSPFIESNYWLIDPNNTENVLHCEEVAGWRLSERNRELVNLTFTTFLDMPIGAGTTILVNIPHAAVTEPLWVQRVEIRVQAQPALFQQTIYGLGGGAVGNPDNLAPQNYNPNIFLYG
jgi:hypothetical protein